MTEQTSSRLQILESSLAKKKTAFDCKLASHIESVRAANGQPLNDKRNGAVTLSRWARQDDSLRNLNESIKKTEFAIDREKSKIAHLASFDVPACLRDLLRTGVIRQWRKHPRVFFVEGVEKARIVVRDDGKLAHKFLKEIPSQDQYAVFRDVFNSANRAITPSQPTGEPG